MNAKNIVYWIFTILLSFLVLSGGAAQLAHQKDAVHGILALGYPLYFVTLLGFWKVLGALALLAPGFPRLKEWAYAGIFFEMTGAAASHAASGDPWWHVAATLGFAMVTIASWALRPESRRLGEIFPARRHARTSAFAEHAPSR